MDLNLFDYIVKTNSGYISDLIEMYGKVRVDELLTVGFIKSGYTPRKKTWSITNLGRTFCMEIL